MYRLVLNLQWAERSQKTRVLVRWIDRREISKTEGWIVPGDCGEYPNAHGRWSLHAWVLSAVENELLYLLPGPRKGLFLKQVIDILAYYTNGSKLPPGSDHEKGPLKKGLKSTEISSTLEAIQVLTDCFEVEDDVNPRRSGGSSTRSG